MQKRILSLLLAACLLLTLTPVTLAAGEPTWAGGSGTSDDPFQIATKEQLAALAASVNEGNSYAGKHFKLTANIDLNNEEWTPIGTFVGETGRPFSGVFDGDGKTIRNLSINQLYGSNVGLFGYTTDGEIKNFTLENAKVIGDTEVGAVAGTPYTSQYTNISVTGLIQVDGYAYVGGALGKNAYADITNVDVTGAAGSYVKAEDAYVGGLVGFMGEGPYTVSGCDVKIDVAGFYYDVGGILGILHYGNTMTDCTYVGSLTLNDPDEEAGSEFGALTGTVCNEAGQTTTISNCTATVIKATSGTEDVTETITAHGDFYYKVTSEDNAGTVAVNATVNSKPVAVTNSVARVDGTDHLSLSAAIAAAGTAPDKTLTLLNDLKDVGAISLPAGVILDGAGHTISGDSSVYINAAGGTVQNVNFKNIHNASKELTSIYASGLTGTAAITGCTFDNIEYESIQVTPQANAVVSITGNTFRHTGEPGPNTKRHVHVQSSRNTDYTVTVTGNKFYDGEKLIGTSIEVSYPTDTSKVNLTRNYVAEPVTTSILKNSGTADPSLAAPFVQEDLNTEIPMEATVVVNSYNYHYYSTFGEALVAAASGQSIVLVKDVADQVIPTEKTATIRLNDKKLTNLTNNGTLTILGATAEGSLTGITNTGTLKIAGGGPYDPAQIANSGTVTVSEGVTFTNEPPADWIPVGYKTELQGDGTYKVSLMKDAEAVASGCVARSGGATVYTRKYFKSLADGFAEKGSLHLITDVTEDVTLAGKSMELYCDDYTFIGSAHCPGKNVVIYTGTATFNTVTANVLKVRGTAAVTMKDGTITGVDLTKNARLTIQGGTCSGSLTLATGGTGSITIQGGYFKEDPSAYVPEGCAVVPSDKAGYAYMVKEQTTPPVAEPAVGAPKVVDSFTGADKATVEAVAASVAGEKTVLTAAANQTAGQVTDVQKTDAEAALKAHDSSVTDGNIRVYSQVYLSVTPTAYDAASKAVTLDIVPKSRIVASTAATEDGIVVVGEEAAGQTANAVVLADSETAVSGIGTIPITVALPDGFTAEADAQYYAKHTHGTDVCYYPLTIDSAGNTATFTNLHGFSAFELPVTLDAAASITVGGEETMYETFQAAVDDAQEGQTVKVLKGESLTARADKAVTIQNGTTGEIAVQIGGEQKTIPAGETATFPYMAYTVTFDTQGGSSIAAVTGKHYGDKVDAPTAVPTKAHYDFGGWYKEEDCATPWDFAADAVTGDVTLYAKWTKHPYTITTVQTDGGTVTAPASAQWGTTVTVTATPAAGHVTGDVTYTVGEDAKPIPIINGAFPMPADNVTVTARFDAYSLSLDTIPALVVGESVKIGAAAVPDSLTFAATTTEFAKISLKDGKIMAEGLKPGTVDVTFAIKQGDTVLVSLEKQLTVLNPASGIQLNQEALTLYTNHGSKTAALTATVEPEGSTDTVTWSSDNEAVATVDQTGVVTAVADGAAIITARAGEKYAQCVVTVASYHNITATCTEGGAVALDPTSAPEGETVTVTVTPDADWQLRQLTATDAQGNVALTKVDDATYTFTMGGSHVAVRAEFIQNVSTPDVYTLSVDTDPAIEVGETRKIGSATVSGGLTLAISPETNGYVTLAWTDGDIVATGVKAGTVEVTFSIQKGGETLEAVTRTITVTPKPAPGGSTKPSTPSYPVTVTETEGGTVSASAKRAAKGSTVTVTVAPDEGWELDKLAVTDANGSTVEVTGVDGSKFTFQMPGTEVKIAATFTQAAFSCDGGERCPSHRFLDVDAKAWYHEAVDYVVSHGMMQGVSGDDFAHEAEATRGMIVTILHRLEGEPAAEGAPFDDVADGKYYTAAVAWAAQSGIVNGYGDGAFGPDNEVTREQLVTILHRYAAYKGWDVTAQGDLSGFADAGQISAYAMNAMTWANAQGLVIGTDNNTLLPASHTTRAQAAAILMRFCESVAK